jgi:hypothetical protein
MKRVLIGKLGTQWVLRVSAPGRDVTTENDPRYILFDSRYAHAGSVYATGTVTTSSGGGGPAPFYYYGQASFPAMDYAPLCLCIQIDGTYVYAIRKRKYSSGTDVRYGYEPRWESAPSYITVRDMFGGWTYRYFVFRIPL